MTELRILAAPSPAPTTSIRARSSPRGRRPASRDSLHRYRAPAIDTKAHTPAAATVELGTTMPITAFPTTSETVATPAAGTRAAPSSNDPKRHRPMYNPDTTPAAA